MLGRAMAAAPSYVPDLGHFVLVMNCPMLPGVGKVVGFEGARPVVQSLACPNLTVAVAARRLVVPERCSDHADCLASVELAVECAHWTRGRARPRAWRDSA